MCNRNKKEKAPEFAICGTCIVISILTTLFKMWLQHRKGLNTNYAEKEVNAIYNELLNSGEVGDNFPHEEFLQLIRPNQRTRWRERFKRLGDTT